ncbi:MAG TPA: TfoX/Sxy family protein [bacterium]|nr:TfoX/Sxy family protein [bacterium]
MTMKWRKSPEALVRKFDTIVPDDPHIERRKMFGYPAAFAGGNLFTGLYQDFLILRLSGDDRAAFLRLQGASLFEPMPGRPMREYATVPAAVLGQDAALAGWIRKSLQYAGSLPAKGARTKAPGRRRRAAGGPRPGTRTGPSPKRRTRQSGRR